MIDYVLVNKEIREKVSLDIREQIDSDHHSVVIRMGDGEGGVEKKGKRKVDERGIWDKEEENYLKRN